MFYNHFYYSTYSILIIFLSLFSIYTFLHRKNLLKRMQTTILLQCELPEIGDKRQLIKSPPIILFFNFLQN